MGVGRFAYTPLLPLMLNEELLSISEGGFIAAIHFLGYWIGALIAPRVPFTPAVSLRISLIIIALCTLGMGLTENFLLWLMFRWLCGACSAFTLVLISNYYIKILIQSGQRYQQGLVFSGVGAGITLVGLGSLVLMLTQTSSLQAWQMTGFATIAVVLFTCLLIGNETSQQQENSSHRQVSRGPLLWRIVLPYGVAGFGYIIPATYLPVMAREFIPSAAVFGWAWPIFWHSRFSVNVTGRAHSIPILEPTNLDGKPGYHVLWATLARSNTKHLFNHRFWHLRWRNLYDYYHGRYEGSTSSCG